MLERPMATRRLTQAIVLAALSLLWATNAQAEELRCIGLGANCICSEPLDTPTLVGSTYWWNPADSITKECSGEGASIGGAILRNSAPISSTDATAMAALPSGHTMLSFVRGEDDHQGIFFVGNGLPVSASFVRLAARWYIWHTPIFDFKGEGTCENSKIAEFDNDSRVDVTGGFHSYNYLTFSPPIDCCVSGPGPNSGVPTSQMKGKWWRFEAVLTNRAGPNYNMKFFGKNITDNGPELTLIDLSTNVLVAKLTPPGLMSYITSNNHRFSALGSCQGWLGISHYMMAGWTTDAGQRIGSATEVEGAGGTITPPPSPKNLKVQ